MLLKFSYRFIYLHLSTNVLHITCHFAMLTLLHLPFYSATYVSCLLAVESYWPQDGPTRTSLTEQVRQFSTHNAADLYKMHELSLYVSRGLYSASQILLLLLLLLLLSLLKLWDLYSFVFAFSPPL